MKQRGKDGQSTGSVMWTYKIAEDKPWKSEALKKSEEMLPRLKECGLEAKVSKLYKAKTGAGCDGFHPKVPLDMCQRKREEKS